MQHSVQTGAQHHSDLFSVCPLWVNVPMNLEKTLHWQKVKAPHTLFSALFVSYNKYLLLWRKEVSLCVVFHILGKNKIALKGYLLVHTVYLFSKRKQPPYQEEATRQSQGCKSTVEDEGDDNSGFVNGNSSRIQSRPHHENMDTLLSIVLVYGHIFLLTDRSWEGHICFEPQVLHVRSNNWSCDLGWFLLTIPVIVIF